MDPALLENYEFQLEQIQEQLEVDPENEALLKLAADLKELIELTRGPTEESKAEPEPAAAAEKTPLAVDFDHQVSAADSVEFSEQKLFSVSNQEALTVGLDVMAKWSQDGRWYPARIDARDAQGRYQVTYTAYGNTEFLNANCIRPQTHQDQQYLAQQQRRQQKYLDSAIPTTSSNVQEATTATSSESTLATTAPKKKKKKQTLEEHHQKKELEQQRKQNAWVQFTKKAGKTMKKQVINDKSIFKTSENPMAKVGVVGSGRPMTEYQTMKLKHQNIVKK